MNSLKINFSIIGITETWITDNDPNIFNIQGYNFITANRKSKPGGGVGLYIAENIEFKERNDLTVEKDDILESLFIECKVNGFPVVIGALYRPPNCSINEFDEQFEKLLDKINRENKLFYLLGDYNIDILKINQNKYAENFINQLSSSFFYPLITKPTRITHNSASLIDNILTNRMDDDDIQGILYTDISDHLPVFTIKRNVKLKDKGKKVKFRRITSANIDDLNDLISNVNWNELIQTEEPNEAYNIFHNKLTQLYNKAIPMKTITNKEIKNRSLRK